MADRLHQRSGIPAASVGSGRRGGPGAFQILVIAVIKQAEIRLRLTVAQHREHDAPFDQRVPVRVTDQAQDLVARLPIRRGRLAQQLETEDNALQDQHENHHLGGTGGGPI